MPYTDFHYTPTGTGVISGKEVLEQTEDAINDLGGQISGDVQTAIDTANNALNTANTASADAQNAVNTANTAYTAATNAQNTANAAQTTATNAQNAATAAQNDVNALGNRVTTAENNITQNTTDISGLTTRMGTAEGNITTLQNDVVTAQGTATSAQNTATMARQQAYVLRYSSTAITDNSTIAYSTLDNTDNIKADDKIIDVDGKIFSVVSVDSDNSTVTVGSVLIDLALDANVVHTSGNETVGGQKTFANNLIIVGRNTDSSSAIQLVNSDVVGDSANGSSGFEVYGSSISNENKIGGLTVGEYSNNGGAYAAIEVNRTVSGAKTSGAVRNLIRSDGSKEFSASTDNDTKLGHPSFRWSAIYGNAYYYGSGNVEFTNKFVTTDTPQTISNTKTFSSSPYIYNQDDTAPTPTFNLRNSKVTKGTTTDNGSQIIQFLDKDLKYLAQVIGNKLSNGSTALKFNVGTLDSNAQSISAETQLYIAVNGEKRFIPSNDNDVALGRTLNRWKDVNTYLVNGLTPSSLSMPSDRSARIDISGYFTNTGTGDTNSYTVPANGYIYMEVADCVSLYIYSQITGNLSNYGNSVCRNTIGKLVGFLPVRKDDVFTSQWYTTLTNVSLISAYFIPCQGNV